MNTGNPWRMPSKVKGVRKIVINNTRDEAFQQSLIEMGRQQSQTYGVKISPETILLNMALYPNPFTKAISAQLLKRYKELKKEKPNVKSIDGIIRNPRLDT
ncbi:hypothetical protein [Streptomyces sp. NPDC056401]|uniref:hypothetical protein n=1 Tax=Streptomyces sp. NPDC056401 TaxID=3345809 RepID=UPI0035E1CB42